MQRSLDAGIETSHAFTLPALLCVEGDSSAARVGAWIERNRVISAELAAIQTEIDARCFALYGIDESDRRVIVEGSDGDSRSLDEQADRANEDEAQGNEEEEEDTDGPVNSEALVADLVSWAVGVAVGRFDVRLATGVRTVPTEPEPFDHLPMWSPATLIGDDNKPSASAPAGYPLGLLKNGIFVDDAGHPRDLRRRPRIGESVW